MGKNGKERKKRRLAQSFQAIAGTRGADAGSWSESDSETEVHDVGFALVTDRHACCV
jgi:hypothetical protein